VEIGAVLLAGVLVGCAVSADPQDGNGAAPGADAGSSAPASVGTVKLTPAREFVAKNAAVDVNLHLLARRYVNKETEVLSLYEPRPGRILSVGAGHPNGPAMLRPSKGKDAVTIWDSLAPGEEMPTALREAIERQAAGVGEADLVTVPEGTDPAIASFGRQTPEGPTAPIPQPSGVRPDVLFTGYCDYYWPGDFYAESVMGSETVLEANAPNPTQYPLDPAGLFAAPIGAMACPHRVNDPFLCTCSCRLVRGFQDLHLSNIANSYSYNNFENYVNVCPPREAAIFTLNATGWSQTWKVGEDYYMWLEDVGDVTCFSTTCTSTHDIPQFNVSISSDTIASDGVINYLAEIYGP
jgi:hypothetical protein